MTKKGRNQFTPAEYAAILEAVFEGRVSIHRSDESEAAGEGGDCADDCDGHGGVRSCGESVCLCNDGHVILCF